MLIGPDWIFVHTPRTGGTAIESALMFHALPATAPPLHKHAHFRDIVATHGRRQWSFGFVRNPWDWIASDYRYAVANANRADRLRDFSPWLDRCREIRAAGWEWFIREACRYRGPRMQHLGFGADGVDTIYRYEDFAAAWLDICQRLGIVHYPLAVVNATEHVDGIARPPLATEYTPELAAMVGEWLADTVEEFGYSPPRCT